MFERAHHQRIAHVFAALRAAVNKASKAYGGAIARDLKKAIVRMPQRQGWLDRCMQVMSVTPAKAVVWQRIRQLQRVCVE